MLGSKTYVVALLMWLGGVTARWGFGFDANIVADVIINMYPLIMTLMRSITYTPPVGSKRI